MPKGTKVHKQVDAMRREGVPVGKAIAIAQSQTHQSYATGKKLPAKRKGKR